MYNFSHLNGPEDTGTIQQDEGIFLYSLIRICGLTRILELGGLEGYSATNFCEALPNGIVYSVDVNKFTIPYINHKMIHKRIKDVSVEDIDSLPLDLIFFDAHDFEEQKQLIDLFTIHKIITKKTFLIFHDTNKFIENGIPYYHQIAEIKLVNLLLSEGFQRIDLWTETIKNRKGLSICKLI